MDRTKDKGISWTYESWHTIRFFLTLLSHRRKTNMRGDGQGVQDPRINKPVPSSIIPRHIEHRVLSIWMIRTSVVVQWLPVWPCQPVLILEKVIVTDDTHNYFLKDQPIGTRKPTKVMTPLNLVSKLPDTIHLYYGYIRTSQKSPSTKGDLKQWILEKLPL